MAFIYIRLGHHMVHQLTHGCMQFRSTLGLERQGQVQYIGIVDSAW